MRIITSTGGKETRKVVVVGGDEAAKVSQHESDVVPKVRLVRVVVPSVSYEKEEEEKGVDGMLHATPLEPLAPPMGPLILPPTHKRCSRCLNTLRPHRQAHIHDMRTHTWLSTPWAPLSPVGQRRRQIGGVRGL